ncbi:MAG: hypothetical protein M3282_11330 [Gemmatimonadota bacterium]|nr:hypothetical protein [Gemmatimonadota bacterium]
MELHKIAIRALFAYAVLLALMRFSGKRVVSEAGARDLVVAIIIGDLIDDLLWAEVGAAKFAAAAGGVVLSGLLVALATYASPAAAALLEGRPQLVLREGVPVRAGMRAERVNEEDLTGLLRARGIDHERWVEVDHAWLEVNGELSAARHELARPAERRDRGRLRREEAQ